MDASITPTDRPRRADARRNRARILEAARAAFAEQGLEAQMDDVARRAGLGVGTLYRHFPTKDALVQALVAARFDELADAARRALADQADPWLSLRDVLWHGGELHAQDRALSQIWPALPVEVVARAVEESGLREAMTRLILRAQAAGAVRDDLTVDDVPMVMCGLGAVVEAAGRGAGVAGWERYLTLVLDGMRARGGPALPT